MNCADFLEKLIDYHFTTESQDRREANRAHLRICGKCTQQYFDLKHDIDNGTTQSDRPSDLARTRLHGKMTTLFKQGLFGHTRG